MLIRYINIANSIYSFAHNVSILTYLYYLYDDNNIFATVHKLCSVQWRMNIVWKECSAPDSREQWSRILANIQFLWNKMERAHLKFSANDNSIIYLRQHSGIWWKWNGYGLMKMWIILKDLDNLDMLTNYHNTINNGKVSL